jgi:hypothetical protein
VLVSCVLGAPVLYWCSLDSVSRVRAYLTTNEHLKHFIKGYNIIYRKQAKYFNLKTDYATDVCMMYVVVKVKVDNNLPTIYNASLSVSTTAYSTASNVPTIKAYQQALLLKLLHGRSKINQ